MTQKPTSDDNAPLIDTLEATHNAFHYFLLALDILKEQPETQCRLMGDYNTAWELQSDIAAGRYLLGKTILDKGDEDAIAALVEAIGDLPADILQAVSGRERNLAAMRHTAWAPLREQAAELRARLQPAATRTAMYLGMHASPPGSGRP
jgi:hypothetical protein